MPVLKVCGNPNTYERMRHDTDLNAGRIITHTVPIDEADRLRSLYAIDAPAIKSVILCR